MQWGTVTWLSVLLVAVGFAGPLHAQESKKRDSTQSSSGEEQKGSSNGDSRVRIEPGDTESEIFRKRCLQNKSCSLAELVGDGDVQVAPAGQPCDEEFRPTWGTCIVQGDDGEKRRVTVAAKDFQFSGEAPRVSARTLRIIAKAYTPAFLSCYNVALGDNESAAGEVGVTIVMDPSTGKQVDIDNESLGGDSTGKCLRLAASMMELPAASGDPYTFAFTLEMSQTPVE